MKRITGPAIFFMFGIFLVSCTYQQHYVDGTQIHATARKAAVLPFVNLTSYPNAGRIVGDLLTTELYALTDIDIIERTEVIAKLKKDEQDLTEVLDQTTAMKIGMLLGADTVIFGSVTEYRYKRGLDEDPVVGINVRMLDVGKNKILWAGSRSATGGCFWFCEDSLTRLTQKVCHNLVTGMIRAD